MTGKCWSSHQNCLEHGGGWWSALCSHVGLKMYITRLGKQTLSASASDYSVLCRHRHSPISYLHGTLALRTFVPCPAFWLLIRLISGKSEVQLLHPFFLSLLFTMYLCCWSCCQLWHCSNDRIRISQFNSQEWQRIKSGQVIGRGRNVEVGMEGKGKLGRRTEKAFFPWQPDFNFIQWSEVTGGVGITAWATCRCITHLKSNVPILIDWLIDWCCVTRRLCLGKHIASKSCLSEHFSSRRFMSRRGYPKLYVKAGCRSFNLLCQLNKRFEH